jgi:hypothetical protein
MAIEKSFPSDPDLVLYNAINSLQMWGDLLKDTDRVQIYKMVEHLGSWIGKRVRHQITSSDVAIL